MDSGLGTLGVFAPKDDGVAYNHMGGRTQVAYLEEGARISQTASVSLIEGENYTLTFDAGQQLTQIDRHFVARIKSNGEILAQAHSSDINVIQGDWATHSFSFTATSDMPIGNSVVVEFHNLATTGGHQVNIDNVKLSIAGTGSDQPGGNLGPLVMIMEDLTLLVPGQYPNIHMALKYLDDKHIKVGKTVTIQVTDCSNQVYTESINVAHPNGNAIHIVGDTDNPESCILQFNGVSGIEVSNGNQLGLIDGFAIKGNDFVEAKGIYANEAAVISIGEKIVISNFESGIHAIQHSKVFANGVIVENCNGSGIYSYDGSYVQAENAISRLNKDGFLAAFGSIMDVDGSQAHSNSRYGFGIFTGSSMHAWNSISNGNGDSGFFGWSGAILHAKNATAKNNGIYGFYGNSLSYLFAVDSTSISNGTSNYHAPANGLSIVSH